VISHLNGGNCTHEEAETYRREFADIAGWDGTLPESPLPIREDRRLRGAPPAVVCPRCGDRMRECAGFDDYCPTCRPRDELQVEREVVAATVAQFTTWFERAWHASDATWATSVERDEPPLRDQEPTATDE
jgi:hypothetical protein